MQVISLILTAYCLESFSGARDLYMLISLCYCIRYLSIEWKKKKHACKFPILLTKCYASRPNTFILGMTIILALFHKYYLKAPLVLSVKELVFHQEQLAFGKKDYKRQKGAGGLAPCYFKCRTDQQQPLQQHLGARQKCRVLSLTPDQRLSLCISKGPEVTHRHFKI